MKYCGRCGAQMEDYADVCVNCKTPFDSTISDDSSRNKKEGNKMAVITVMILISVLIFFACYCFIEFSFYNSLLDF